MQEELLPLAKAAASSAEANRTSFWLLTDPPLTAAVGQVVLSEVLPRALTSVQIVRIVPITSDGREAEFDSCPVVAIAVPTDRRPPAPTPSLPSGQQIKAGVPVDRHSGKATFTIAAL
jgi:hypothetical protein